MGRAMKAAPVRHAVEFGFFKLLAGMARALPHVSSRRLGRALGALAYRLLAGRRRVALRNLELALPELDDDRRSAIARASFRHMAAQAAELLSWTHHDSRALCRLWTLEGWEHVEEVAARSKGFFLMTAHFGYWELVGQATALYAPPMCAVVRPLDNARFDAWLTASRTRFGGTLLEKHGATRRLVHTLRDGGSVIVLIDQRVRPREAVEVPFFGRPARTTHLVASLALKHEAPVVPIYAYPAPGGRYRLVVRPPIAPVGRAAEAIRELTGRYTAAVEAEIRLQPELWLWMHDRWRST